MQGELTYGKIGEWRFDKRSYTMGAPPKNLPLPPKGVPETVVRFISYLIINVNWNFVAVSRMQV